jgi:hypothetical protein
MTSSALVCQVHLSWEWSKAAVEVTAQECSSLGIALDDTGVLTMP